MKNLFKILAIVVLALVSFTVNAQNVYEYTYDAAGNRTSRLVVALKAGVTETDLTSDISGEASEAKVLPEIKNVGELNLTLFPNPTLGKINIKAENLTEHSNCEVSIYNAQGALIKTAQWSPSASEIDFSDSKQGVYIVKFKAGNSITEWKVVKE